MTEYTPDNWVIIKVDDSKENFYKILAGWSGGYITGSSWKMEEQDNYYKFYGNSGSYYVCHKEAYGLRMNNAHIWQQLKEMYGDKVQLMDENTDWNKIEWKTK
jgi:hypothetical protein